MFEFETYLPTRPASPGFMRLRRPRSAAAFAFSEESDLAHVMVFHEPCDAMVLESFDKSLFVYAGEELQGAVNNPFFGAL